MKCDSRDGAATIILGWVPGDVDAVSLDFIIIKGSFWRTRSVQYNHIEGSFILATVILHSDLVLTRVTTGSVDSMEDAVVVDGSDGGAHISLELLVIIKPEHSRLWLTNVVHIDMQYLASLDADVIQWPQDLGLHCGHQNEFQLLRTLMIFFFTINTVAL